MSHERPVLMVRARAEARRMRHSVIEVDHVFLALVRDEESVAVRVLRQLGVDIEFLVRESERRLEPGPGELEPLELPLSWEVRSLLEVSREEAEHLGHASVSSAHVLLGLLRHRGSIAARLLQELHSDLDRMREAVRQTLER